MSEYVSVSIPESLARQARLLAQKRQRSLDSVISELLDSALPPAEQPRESDTAILREMEAYTRLHQELRKTHLGKYVAILDGALIDADTDAATLYERIDRRHPDRFVWITLVEEEPLAEIRFRSPRISTQS